MIRSVNDLTGFYCANTTNINYIDDTMYPEQDSNFVGKFLTLRFKNDINQTLYNRYYIPSQYSKYHKVENSPSDPVFFKIVRFDKAETNKCILVGEGNQVIITTTDRIKSLYNLKDSSFLNVQKKLADFKGYDLLDIEMTDSVDTFFNEYNTEFVHKYPIQNDTLLGMECYIEFDNNIDKPKQNFPILPKNNHDFTEEMRNNLVLGEPVLDQLTDEQLNNYPYRYDIHGQSNIDDPRRYSQKGIIIRADYSNYDDATVIVMEESSVENYKTRFICIDEASLYINTKNTDKRKNTFYMVNNRPILGASTT